jgi:hypothetical protein
VPFADAEVIFAYTRAQALADGVLVDVSKMAREAGFRWPVAMTADAWEDCVSWDRETAARHGVPQDEAGRLWDVLWMASHAARAAARRNHDGPLNFDFRRIPRQGRGRTPKMATLTIWTGPGDDGEPVITIMLPGED